MTETKCIKNCTKARMTRKAEERTKAMIEWLDTNCPKMTKEEIINGLKLTIGKCLFDPYTVELSTEQISFTEKLTIDACKGAIDLLEQEHTKEEKLKHEPILDKIKAEIEQIIEQERFARSVFRGEEKDYAKAEQCTGSIMAYNNVIRLIDKYRTERSEKE